MYADGVHGEAFVVALPMNAGGLKERMARNDTLAENKTSTLHHPSAGQTSGIFSQ
jgi:hypothetical protein